MPKQFYTEKDIDDLFNRGTRSLQVTDEVVLTELAYERAKRLGLQLITDGVDNPPAAPVRPYLSDAGTAVQTKPTAGPMAQAVSQPNLALTPASPSERSAVSRRERESSIEQRIRSAVVAKLGDQVDAKLLDNIIHRVVKGIGLK
jgi:hypothetical protein